MRPRGFLTSPCLVEELEARIAGADSQERLSFLVSGHTLCVMIPTVWVHTICGEVNGGLMSFQQSQDTWSRWLGLGYARVQQWNGRLLCTTSCWLCWVENGVSAAPVQGLMGLILLTARGTRWSFKMVACKCFLATDFFPAMSLGWYCGSIIVDHNTSATWAIQLEALLARPLCFFSIALTSAQSSMPHSGTGPKVGPGGAGSNLWWRRRHLPSPFLESKPVQLFGSLGPRLAAIQSRNSYNS